MSAESNSENIRENDVEDKSKNEQKSLEALNQLSTRNTSNSSSTEDVLNAKHSKQNSPSTSNPDNESISIKCYDRLIEELRCPGCSLPMRPPIRLCATGHSNCEKCTIRLDKCPLCKKNFTEMRSYTLEALCCKAQFRCSNVAAGCNVRLPLDLLDWHEKQCQHKIIKCFMGRVWGNCDWLGRETLWREHLESEHNDKVFNGKFAELTWNMNDRQVPLASYYVFNYKDETFNLYQIYDKENSRVLWSMAACTGTPLRDQNYKFAYEVEIFREDDESKVICQRYPCHHELDKDILQEGTCVSIPIVQIINFAMEKNNDKIIHYRVKIHKINCSVKELKSSKDSSPKHLPIDYKSTDIQGVNHKNVSPDVILTRREAENQRTTYHEFAIEEFSKRGYNKNKNADSDSDTDPELEAFVNDMMKRKWPKGLTTPNANRKFWDENYAYGSMQSLDVMKEKYEALDNSEPFEGQNHVDRLKKKNSIKSFRGAFKLFTSDN